AHRIRRAFQTPAPTHSSLPPAVQTQQLTTVPRLVTEATSYLRLCCSPRPSETNQVVRGLRKMKRQLLAHIALRTAHAQQTPHRRSSISRRADPTTTRSSSCSRDLRRGTQHLRDRFGVARPCARLPLELLTAPRGQRVVLRATVRLRQPPLGCDPATPLDAVQRGVQRAILDLQHAIRRVADPASNRIAMTGAEDQRLEYEQVECALEQIQILVAHRCSPQVLR